MTLHMKSFHAVGQFLQVSDRRDACSHTPIKRGGDVVIGFARVFVFKQMEFSSLIYKHACEQHISGLVLEQMSCSGW